MNCEKCEILISAYIDGELTQREEKTLLKHIDECSGCRKKLESMRVMSNQLSGLRKIEGDISERNRLIANLHELMDKEPAPKPVLPWLTTPRLAWASALAVAAIVLIAFLSMNNNSVSTTPKPETIPTHEFAMLEDILVEGIVDYLEQERIYACSNETFSEPILAVFAFDPTPPPEGYVDNFIDTPIHTGG